MINCILFDFYDVIKSSKNSEYDFDVISIVKKLTNNYQLGLVSNARGPRVRASLVETNLDKSFDAVLISGEVGIEKPDKHIFQLALDALGVKAQETIFIDDKVEYLGGALELGIQTITFESSKLLIRDLRKHNIAI